MCIASSYFAREKITQNKFILLIIDFALKKSLKNNVFDDEVTPSLIIFFNIFNVGFSIYEEMIVCKIKIKC